MVAVQLESVRSFICLSERSVGISRINLHVKEMQSKLELHALYKGYLPNVLNSV